MEPKPASRDFGLNVKVQRQPYPKMDVPPTGDPVPEGEMGLSITRTLANNTYRQPIPAGTIGSAEVDDLTNPPLQYVDTVEDYSGAQADPKLHGPMDALRSAGKQEIPFQDYARFQPRRAPMPRAAQDEGYLGPPGRSSADPLMTDQNAGSGLSPRDIARKDMFGANRDGVLKDTKD
jgi:hypothetical protein